MRSLQQLELAGVYPSTGKQLGDDLHQSLPEIPMGLNLAIVIELIGVKRSMIPYSKSTQVNYLESLQNFLGLGSIG